MAAERESKGHKIKIVLIKLATAPRPQATGKGREGVNPFPKG